MKALACLAVRRLHAFLDGFGRDMATRVLHIITRMILGGAQENTLLTCEGLHASPEWRVALLTGPAIGPEGELIRRARSRGIRTVVLPAMRRNIHPLLDAGAFAGVLGFIREFQPDIVHTHSSKAGVIGRLAARAARVPVIVHTIHGLPFHPYQGRFSHAAFVAAERAAARCCDRLVTVADAMTRQALAAGVGRPEQYVTIYSGMEVEPFLSADCRRDAVPHRGLGRREAARRALGFDDDDIIIGKVARLFELKGHRYVIEAAPEIVRRCPKARFLFVGDGILRPQLREQAERLGVADRIVFAGLVDSARIPDMVSAMDVLVHASLREGLPRAVVQALLAGRPVVCYDVDGAPEVVVDGVTGLLVPPESVQELAQAVVTLIEQPERASAMAREGQRRTAAAFSAQTMVLKLEQLYRALLAARQSAQ